MKKDPIYYRLQPVFEEPGEDAPHGLGFCMGTARFLSTREQGPVLSVEAVRDIRAGKLVPNPTPGREKFLLNMLAQVHGVLSTTEGTLEERAAVARQVSSAALRFDGFARGMAAR